MINEFNEACPLTGKSLENWLRLVVARLDETFVIASDLIAILYAQNSGAVITSVFPAEDFNSIFEAIKSGKTLKTLSEGAQCTVVTANVLEVPSDDYKAFEIELYGSYEGDTGFIKLGVESLFGDLRLYTKSFAEVAYTSL